ncbi:MAG: ornithine carbamoyltransferase [bacterium]|nr:ornithine carbamoyltransferase [bacterium]
MRHLISLFDITAAELTTIIDVSHQLKTLHATGKRPALLQGLVLAMLFEKPSLRTRVSFEAGMAQLGGTALFLGQEVGWQKRESTSDFTRVLAQYADFVVCRANKHASVQELASFDAVPVINGLTDLFHPCQALADLLTMQESTSEISGKQVTFVGDGNNVAKSLALACAMSGMRFRLLGPKAYFMSNSILQKISERYPQADISQTESVSEAMASADFVYTDVWTSMGQESESKQRELDFAPFQLNQSLMKHAPSGCKVLHCLPAHRGMEITDEVIDSRDSLVIQQAGNRMHAQKGLLIWLAIEQGLLSVRNLEQHGLKLTG